MSAAVPGAGAGHHDPHLIGTDGSQGTESTESRAPEPWVRATGPDPVSPVLADELGIVPEVRWDAWRDLPPERVSGLLRLRPAERPEPADLDPDARHVWVDDADTGPVAALRVRPVPDGASARSGAGTGGILGSPGSALLVERLGVRPDMRHLGLAGALITEVVARSGGLPLVADVPSHAVRLFARLAFAPVASVLDPADPVEPLTRMRRMPDAPWREP